MKIYLIRHAISVDGQNKISQRDDSPLVENISTKLPPIKPDKVFCSPILRAEQTAELLFPGRFEILDYIYEYQRPRFLTGNNKKEADIFWKTGIEKMKKDPNWSYDGSESFVEIKNRVLRLLSLLKSLDLESVAIIGHGIFFRYLIGINILGENFDQVASIKIMKDLEWANLELKEIEINK
jgi:broad specificity phosphatase PhoE